MGFVVAFCPRLRSGQVGSEVLTPRLTTGTGPEAAAGKVTMIFDRGSLSL